MTLKTTGIAANDLRVLAEPRRMPVTGMLSTPDNDFCAALRRDLRAMGATDAEAQAYIEGVRDGGVLVLANGLVEQVRMSAGIMNRHQAVKVEELTGSEPALAGVDYASGIPMRSQFQKERTSGGT